MTDPTPLLGLDRSDTRRALNQLDVMGSLIATFAPNGDSINVDRTTRRFYYLGGVFRDGLGGWSYVPDGFIVCPDASVSIVQFHPVTGVTVDATLDPNNLAIAEVTCAGGLLTHIEDLRGLNFWPRLPDPSTGEPGWIVAVDYDGTGFELVPEIGLTVEEDDVTEVNPATILNFEGNVDVTDEGGGKATIRVPPGLGTGAGGHYQGHHAGTTPYEALYAAGINGEAITGTLTPSAVGNLYAFPFQAPDRGGTIDQVSVVIGGNAGAGSTTVRIGIYDSVSVTEIYPGTLLFDSGPLSLATTGHKTASCSVDLLPGVVYWLIVHNESSPTALYRTGSPQAYWPILGWSVSGATVAQQIGLLANQTYGAMPDPFPGGATVLTSGNIPALFYRFSA